MWHLYSSHGITCLLFVIIQWQTVETAKIVQTKSKLSRWDVWLPTAMVDTIKPAIAYYIPAWMNRPKTVNDAHKKVLLSHKDKRMPKNIAPSTRRHEAKPGIKDHEQKQCAQVGRIFVEVIPKYLKSKGTYKNTTRRPNSIGTLRWCSLYIYRSSWEHIYSIYLVILLKNISLKGQFVIIASQFSLDFCCVALLRE